MPPRPTRRSTVRQRRSERRALGATAIARWSKKQLAIAMLRHTFATTMLDASLDPRDVQIAARHTDPRTTMRYDPARKNLD
jgi:integrase/recombinase XerD